MGTAAEIPNVEGGDLKWQDKDNATASSSWDVYDDEEEVNEEEDKPRPSNGTALI